MLVHILLLESFGGDDKNELYLAANHSYCGAAYYILINSYSFFAIQMAASLRSTLIGCDRFSQKQFINPS